MSSLHSDLTGTQLHEAFQYVQDADPGAVGAGKYWLETDVEPNLLWRRNLTDDDWISVGASLPTAFAFAYQRQTNQSITDDTDTAISFTATFFIDNGSWFSIGQPTRFTVPTGGGGIYKLESNVLWGSTTGGRRCISIRRNGTDIIARVNLDDGGADEEQHCGCLFELSDADYLELIVRQVSGGNLNAVNSGFHSPVISGIKVG